jgi:hypothetical protein
MIDYDIYDGNMTNEFSQINQAQYIPLNQPQYIPVNHLQYISVNKNQDILANQPQNIPLIQPQCIPVIQPQYITVNQHQNSLINQFDQKQLKNSLDSIEVQKVINMLRQNPNLLNQFNEEVKRDNNNFNEHSIFNDSIYIKMASRGEVPRKIFSQIKNNKEIISINTDYNPNIINVCFEISSGQKFNEKAAKNMIFKDLCINFVTKLGFQKSIIENKDIIFLFNGTKVDINQKKNLREIGIENNSKILVLDLKGLIGAYF